MHSNSVKGILAKAVTYPVTMVNVTDDVVLVDLVINNRLTMEILAMMTMF